MNNIIITDFLKFNFAIDGWRIGQFVDSLSEEENREFTEKMFKEIEEFLENEELLFPLIAELFIEHTRIKEHLYTTNRGIFIDEDILFIKVLSLIQQLKGDIIGVFLKGMILENNNEDKYFYKGENSYSKKYLRTCQMYKSIIDFFSDRSSYCSRWNFGFVRSTPSISDDDIEGEISDGIIRDIEMNFTLNFIEYLKENEEKYGWIYVLILTHFHTIKRKN